MHIDDTQRRRWIAARLESHAPQPDRGFILERLIRADLFEQVLQARYLGSKRFSLEGVTAVIPLLDHILTAGAAAGAEQVVLGMSHRGRLNVMAHIAGQRAADIFAGFEDVDPRSVLGSGDVKYHVGATGEYRTRDGRKLSVHLASNPSHLEAVDPVVVGRARAKQARAGYPGGAKKVLPILLHGDAAFAGQGVWAETLNFADLGAYSVGGTIHVIVNNLLGFTTSPPELHSSRFASALAKRQAVPIFHVNAEDPDAVMRVGQIALDYRSAFAGDVVIDLIGYRRHGHSEVDDPTITQPLLYKAIKDHPPLWEIYAERSGAADAKVRVEAVRAELE
ncbi:MAG: thiamine pyrophosphate-dependent enzyme, partial [Terracidiphilus sp.]